MPDNGTRVAVGALFYNGRHGSGTGHVIIYEFDDSGMLWTRLGDDYIDGETEHEGSGYSVSTSGDGTSVAFGAYYFGNGHVRVYELDIPIHTSFGSSLGKVLSSEAGCDLAGAFVSLSSDSRRVAIGARGNDGNGAVSGHARVYELYNSNPSNIAWVKRGQDILTEWLKGMNLDILSRYKSCDCRSFERWKWCCFWSRTRLRARRI
jgi:hypothetical protein